MSKEGKIPLKGIVVHAKLRDFVAEVEVLQRYKNEEEEAIEADFAFPLDPKCAVCKFTAEFEGKYIEGKCMPKEKAKETYEDTIAAGGSAFMMQQETAEVFRISVGKLDPGKEVVLRLVYVMEMEWNSERNCIDFTFQNTLKNKYKLLQPEAREEAPEILLEHLPQVPYGFEFDAVVRMSQPIVEIDTKNFNTHIDKGEDETRIVFEKEEQLVSREITFAVVLENIREIQVVSERNEDFPTYPFASMAYIVPKLSRVEAVNSELIFLVDCSGSMMGAPLEAAKRAMALFLQSLPEEVYFNIYKFGSTFESCFEAPVAFNEDSFEEARKYVALFGDMGGTEVFSPMKAILENKVMPGRSRQIFVLTDGGVYNVQQILDLIRSNLKTTRVFTLGLGSGVSRQLVDGMAEVGRGIAEYAIVADSELGPKVIAQLHRALKPSINGATVESKNEILITPAVLPPIFEGSRALVYCLSTTPQVVDLTFKWTNPDGTEGVQRVEFDTNEALERERVIHILGARTRIQEMENEKKADHKKEIEDMGCEFGLITSATSYIAVCKSENGKALDKPLPLRVAALPSPSHSGMAAPANFPVMAATSHIMGAPMRRMAAPRERGMMEAMPAMPAMPAMSPGIAVDMQARAMQTEYNARPKQEEKKKAKRPEAAQFMKFSKEVRYGDTREAEVEPAIEVDVTELEQASMDRLLFSQKLDGHWQFSHIVEQKVSKSSEELLHTARSLSIEGSDEEVLNIATTLCVIYILKTNYAEKAEEWKLIVHKAEKYLEKKGVRVSPEEFYLKL